MKLMKKIKIVFIVLVLLFCASSAFAVDLDVIRSHFIAKDYKAAITEGEKILARPSESVYGMDEVYYILGLSYCRDGNYLRASDIFEIIIGEFRKSKFIPDAKLGLADTFFLRGNYERAAKEYAILLADKSADKFRASLYYRLSRCASMMGNQQAAKDYSDRLKKEFPLNIEAGLEKPGCVLPVSGNNGSFFTVQVGSFSSMTNASKLLNELTKKGYSAYIEKPDAEAKQIYRVKVGKLSSLKEAETLENQLSQEGYPTKVCP